MPDSIPFVDLPELDLTTVPLMMTTPFVVRDATRGWPVNAMLTSGDLWRRYHDAHVRLSGDEALEGLTLGEHLQSGDDGPPSSAWWNVHEERHILVDDLPVGTESWFDRLPEAARPPWTWLFVGQHGSRSSLHVDTMCSSAWNGLLCGVKVWRILSPAHSVRLGLLDAAVAGHLPAADEVAYRFEQRPGDLLVVPGGWAHDVCSVGETVAVTGNFVNESNIDVVEAALGAVGDDLWRRIASRVRSVMECSNGLDP